MENRTTALIHAIKELQDIFDKINFCRKAIPSEGMHFKFEKINYFGFFDMMVQRKRGSDNVKISLYKKGELVLSYDIDFDKELETYTYEEVFVEIFHEILTVYINGERNRIQDEYKKDLIKLLDTTICKFVTHHKLTSDDIEPSFFNDVLHGFNVTLMKNLDGTDAYESYVTN